MVVLQVVSAAAAVHTHTQLCSAYTHLVCLNVYLQKNNIKDILWSLTIITCSSLVYSRNEVQYYTCTGSCNIQSISARTILLPYMYVYEWMCTYTPVLYAVILQQT